MSVLEKPVDIGLEPIPEEEIPASTLEREARFQATLRAVNIISEQAGKELPMRAVEFATIIPDEPGIFILSEHFGNGRDISDVNFDLRPLLLSGAADSAHSVIAGGLTVDFKGGDVRQIEVAAKCYAKRTPAERYERAMREVIIMEDLAQRGELTVEPIALAIAEDQYPTAGEVIVLTRYNPNLLSMDNLPWGRGVEDQSNVDNAVLAAKAIGHFNAHLAYMHGDAKIKNVAVEDGNGYGMIDFETSHPIDPEDAFSAASVATVDFGTLIDSLEKKGFLVKNGLRQTRQVINMLGEAYASMWSEAPEDVQDLVMHAVTQITSKFDPLKMVDIRG